MPFQKVLLAAGVAGALLGVVPHASAALEAIVHLDQLICVKESDPGGAEPYAWTALVTGIVNPVTKAVVGDIKVVAPAVAIGDRAVIKKGMRAGQRANMPAAQRTLVQYFGDFGANEVGFAAIVVVLLEDDGMPESATRAGYRKFREALKNELTSFIKANNGQLPMDLEAIRRAIQSQVVRAARNAVSVTDKFLTVLGFKGKDEFLGFDSASTIVVRPATTPFMEGPLEGPRVPSPLSFEREITIPATVAHPSGAPPIVITPEQKVLADSFRLEGRFEVRRAAAPPPPPPPPSPRPRPPGTHEE